MTGRCGFCDVIAAKKAEATGQLVEHALHDVTMTVVFPGGVYWMGRFVPCSGEGAFDLCLPHVQELASLMATFRPARPIDAPTS